MLDKKKKRSSKYRRSLIYGCIIAIIAGFMGLYALTYPFLPWTGSPQYETAYTFLSALLNGESEDVLHLMSNNLEMYVQSECLNSSISGCLEELIDPSWGEFKEFYFTLGSGSRNTNLYSAFYTNSYFPVSIVLIMTEENGQWRVDGLRGFIISEGENADSQLLKGERTDNQFP